MVSPSLGVSVSSSYSSKTDAVAETVETAHNSGDWQVQDQEAADLGKLFSVSWVCVAERRSKLISIISQGLYS